MDANLEKSCLEEISHTVIDANAKITVRTISNNYGLNFAEAVKILQRWIDANSAKVKLLKEFVVRGYDEREATKGCAFITLASERKLKAIHAKASNVSSVLYSVEVAAESGRRLTVPEDQEFRMINLPLKTDKRDLKVFTPVETPPPAPKQENKPKINTLFGSSAAASSKVTALVKTESSKSVVIKDEKQSPPPKKSDSTAKASSSPQKSPSKGSPGKKSNSKKPVTGKASIASFFSNKPTATSKSSVSNEVKEEKVSPKVEPKIEPPKSVEKNKPDEAEQPRWKRMISDESEGDDEVVPNTPQEKKESKKRGAGAKKGGNLKKVAAKNANPSKKSRIMQLEDSSEEDEQDADSRMQEREDRQVTLEVSEDEDVDMKAKQQELSPEKPVENDANHTNKKRIKVKKEITRTFMDDEGYLTTIKSFEMVSASEDEAENVTSASNAPGTGKKDSDPPAETKGKATSKEKASATKVTPPTAKTKQGSIMSFFSKK